MNYRIERAEEGTPAVDNYLAAGWEPFAVVSNPVLEEVVAFDRVLQSDYATGEHRHVGNVNVIYFRRCDA